MKIIDKILETEKTTTEEAIKAFDELPVVEIDFMIGKWKGTELFSGSQFDGLLTSIGWYGKVFESEEKVAPLVFYTDKTKKELFFADPLKTMNADPSSKEQSEPVFLGEFRDNFETTNFKARLRMLEYRGVSSATMIYDDLPINDIFRKVDENTVMGVMDRKGTDKPYFFLLKRDNE